jgi:protein-disulfide isomerase
MRKLALALLFALCASTAVVSAQAPPAPAPTAEHDPKNDALRAFLDGYLPWGKAPVSIVDITGHPVPGWRIVRALKKYGDKDEGSDQVEAAVDDAGKHALVGYLFADDERLGKTMPVSTERDLDGVLGALKRVFGPVRLGIVLDPSADLPGWKGAKLAIETGYGSYQAPAFVTASDGGFILLGRAFDRTRPIPEQRRQAFALEGAPSIGDANARVTVVEFSDMECPSCKRRTGDWERLAEKLGSSLKVKRYFKMYPLTSIHPWAFRAASAARCFFAKDPALFLSWKSSVYARQDDLTVDALDSFALDFAQANGMSADDFRACYLQSTATKQILKDMAEGFSLGVRSTPSFFVDGVLVAWRDDDTMEEYLRATYMNGAGLPLPKRASSAPAPGTPH